MSDLSIRQYSYIAIFSKILTSQEIEDRLKLKADIHEQWGKGRLRIDPSYQLTNVWKLIAQENSRVDDQIRAIVKRIMPATLQIQDLVSTSVVEVNLQIVRHFNDANGAKEIVEEDGDMVKLTGQHQLLGWHLDAETLAFLTSIKAEIDVDEYN